jgi:hypothetical protein
MRATPLGASRDASRDACTDVNVVLRGRCGAAWPSKVETMSADCLPSRLPTPVVLGLCALCTRRAFACRPLQVKSGVAGRAGSRRAPPRWWRAWRRRCRALQTPAPGRAGRCRCTGRPRASPRTWRRASAARTRALRLLTQLTCLLTLVRPAVCMPVADAAPHWVGRRIGPPLPPTPLPTGNLAHPVGLAPASPMGEGQVSSPQCLQQNETSVIPCCTPARHTAGRGPVCHACRHINMHHQHVHPVPLALACLLCAACRVRLGASCGLN